MNAPVDVRAVLDGIGNASASRRLTPEERDALYVAREAVAELIEQRDALRGALDRIVWYYDATQRNGRLPSMHSQAECQHESTMFGEARAVLAKCGGAK